MMGNAPERIFAWVYEEGSRRHHVWCGKVGPGGDGQTEYVRADLAPARSWQPFETMPAGVVVDIWVPGVGRVTDTKHGGAYEGVTHWMHRPAPPEAS